MTPAPIIEIEGKPVESSIIKFTGFEALAPPSIPAEALVRRNRLVAKLRTAPITTQAEHDEAEAAEKEAKADCKAAEDGRVALTALLLKPQRLLMELKNSYCLPGETGVEASRKLRFEFCKKRDAEIAELARKAKEEADRVAREAEEKRLVEEKRIASEKAAAQKILDDEMEAKRLKYEAEIKALNAQSATLAQVAHVAAVKSRSISDQFAAMAETARIEAAAEQATELAKATAEASKMQVATTAPLPAPSLKQPWKWEVLDIWKFAAANKDLVNPPTPKAREIEAQIKMGIRTMEGARIWQGEELKR